MCFLLEWPYQLKKDKTKNKSSNHLSSYLSAFIDTDTYFVWISQLYKTIVRSNITNQDDHEPIWITEHAQGAQSDSHLFQSGVLYLSMPRGPLYHDLSMPGPR